SKMSQTPAETPVPAVPNVPRPTDRVPDNKLGCPLDNQVPVLTSPCVQSDGRNVPCGTTGVPDLVTDQVMNAQEPDPTRPITETSSPSVLAVDPTASVPAPDPSHQLAPGHSEPPLAVDDGMTVSRSSQQSSDGTSTAPAAPTARRRDPTRDARGLNGLLQRTSELRRDRVQTPAPRRVEMPRPLAVDIDAVDALYEAGGDWSLLAPSIVKARPYQLPRARFVMVLATGQAFQRTSPSKLLMSFLNDHGNEVVQCQLDLGQIGQLTKLPGGDLRVMVKSKEACLRLERQEVKLLGGKYKFKEFDALADRYFIDVSSVDSDVEADLMLRGFYELGAQPIYGTFRDVNMDAVVTTATWRVYFRSSQCPPALIVNGTAACTPYTQGTLRSSQRMGFGHRSRHLLDLSGGQPQGAQPRQSPPSQPSFADVVRRPSSRDLLAPGVNSPARPSTPTQLAPSTPSELSLDTDVTELPSPPPSPRASLPALPPPVSTCTTLATVPAKTNKRSRNDRDCCNLLTKSRPKPVEGIATSNYFDVLGTVEVDIQCRQATADPELGARFQIVPVNVRVPEMARKTKAARHFLTKRHNTVVKTQDALSFQEILDAFEAAEDTTRLQLSQEQLQAADACVPQALTTLETCANPDVVVFYTSVKSPLATQTALMRLMRESSSALDTLAQVHTVNRVLSATTPEECSKCASKWVKMFKTKMPKSRQDLLTSTASWWLDGDLRDLVRHTKALALFEVMLMCTAPQRFTKDTWVQLLTGHSVPWIPAHNTRLLHANSLVALLRSPLGQRCFELWEDAQWNSSMLQDLIALRDSTKYFPDEQSTLQLKWVDGIATLTADAKASPSASTVQPSWTGISLLTVNVNGVKKNGHLLIDHLLARHSLCCVQESKFRACHQLDTFKFHLAARFKHKLFVSDVNALSHTAVAARSGGVLTVLRSDFPGYATAEMLDHISVPGRYIVVKMVVTDATLYVHNVYAPVDEHDKQIFFDNLPVDGFETDATHLVLGDLNSPLDPRLGSSRESTRSRPGCGACRRWLARLGVIDPWRVHNPDMQVYTGPQPRRNRLDYILMSEPFSAALYGDGENFTPKGAGDHLAHRVSLRSMSQLQGHGYWRFPSALLEYPAVVDAIAEEADAVLSELRAASNPGRTWERWKKHIRRLLQALQTKLRAQDRVAVVAARRVLDAAAARFRIERDPAAHAGFTAAMASYRSCVIQTQEFNQDEAFDRHIQQSEQSSRHFFRPPDPSLHRVSVEEVRLRDGRLSTSAADISLRFRDHWGAIMGDHSCSGGVPPPVNAAKQRERLSSITRAASDSDQHMLNATVTASELPARSSRCAATQRPVWMASLQDSIR
ncbi:TPA: hypothetical protein N0F65_011266, partial [Lagenidium giganteum]